jgi:hydroxymethylpyrimidine pyrophosphatase-like HAD family hydrolase
MLGEAGLGIAMGNAIEEARAVADVHTLGNDADGVAVAIDRMLKGEW